MPGSSLSVSGCNIVLNTVVAEELRQFADVLEKSDDFLAGVNQLVADCVKNHKRIIFNGNNYSEEWLMEAQKRGLSNYATTVEALPHFLDKKNIEVFTRLGIFTETEIKSRYEILMENYCKIVKIEALTMIDMARKYIIPSGYAYQKVLADTLNAKSSAIGISPSKRECEYLANISSITEAVEQTADELDSAIANSMSKDVTQTAINYKESVLSAMNRLRFEADKLERLVAKEYWAFPTYLELLF